LKLVNLVRREFITAVNVKGKFWTVVSYNFTALKQWYLSDSWHHIAESLLVLVRQKEVFLTRLNQ